MSLHAQPDWQSGRVVASAEVAQGIRRITINRPPSSRALPGAHLDVRVRIGHATDIRSYSVVESNDDGSVLTISVLRVPRSRGGSVFMHRLLPGDVLEVTQPLQNFPLRVGAPRYVLLAGGVGITALVESARVLGNLGLDYQLMYVGRSRGRMAYLHQLAEVHGDRLIVHIDDEGTPLDVAGLVRSVEESGARDSTELYMCGPIRLMDAVRRAWEAATLPPANLRYETFGNSGWFQPRDFVARIPRLGIEATVHAHETLLEALTRAGADLMYDCRKGECGLCELAIEQVDGVVDHRDVFLSERQKATGRSLCSCVSRVVSEAGSDRLPTISLAP
jgi:ferredoxin-NADP reductase